MDWKEVLPPSWALALVGLVVLIALVVALIREKYRVRKIEVAPLPGVKVELGPEEKPAAPTPAMPPTVTITGEHAQVSLGPDGRNISNRAFRLGWALLRLGEIERARPYLLQAADMFEEIGLLDYAERHRRAARL